jgi:hypothetical protein
MRAQIPPRQICYSHTLPPSPSLYLILSLLFKNKFSLSWLFLYLTSSSTSHLLNSLTFSSPQLITSHFHLPLSLSPLELPDLFIFSINYLTFSSTSLSLSPLELLDLFISPINCTPNFLFKSYVGIFFFF